MPLNLSNRDQNSGHLFYNRRLKAAITRFSVRMKHDDRKQQAAVALSMVFVLIGVGWMALLHVMKPAGLVGQSAIIGNRDTGAVYAKINGRLYPALNLTSARLAVGNAAAADLGEGGRDRQVSDRPDDRHSRCARRSHRHTERRLGMVGLRHRARPGAPDAPLVTSIAGELATGGRAAPMHPTQAVLATHKGATYVIWGGQRSQIDPADRSVTFNLGLDPGVTYPIEISNALFDAMPSTEPLVMPAIPESGTPSTLLAGLDGGQRAGDPRRQRHRHRLLRAAAGRRAEDHQLRRRPAAHRQLAGIRHADAGVAGQADPHSGRRETQRRLLPVRQAEFR